MENKYEFFIAGIARNKEIYKHYGFVEHIKNAKEIYPDGTEIDVEYYGKKLK